MKTFVVVIVLAWCPQALAQVAQFDQPIKTTLCEIKAHPEHYQHKLVEFTAIASHGFEDSMVEDFNCQWPVKGNPGVWMEYGGTRSTATIYFGNGSDNDRDRPEPMTADGIQVPLIQDDLFKQFDMRLHPEHPPQRQSDLVRSTVRGMMFVHQEVINGRKYWGGYGHMGCCLLFVVTQVTAVDPAKVKPMPIPALN